MEKPRWALWTRVLLPPNLGFAQCLSDFKVLLSVAKREPLPNPAPWFPEISRLKFSLGKGQDIGLSGKVRTQVIYASTLFQTDR